MINPFCQKEGINSSNPQHFQEWTQSGISPDLIALNLISAESEDEIASWFFQHLGTEARRNDGRIRDGYLKRYHHQFKGGWAIAGYDPTNFESPPQWRCFKPDLARVDSEGRRVKYDLPIGGDFHPILARVSYRVAYLCLSLAFREARFLSLDSAGELIPSDKRESEEECPWFWQYILTHPQIPITFTEGGKKALALLSRGRVAIALLSVTLWKEKGTSQLHPFLALYARKRRINLCYDQDVKPKTIRNVNLSAFKLGCALKRAEASIVKRLAWQGAQKGIDDQIFYWATSGNKSPEGIRKELYLIYKNARDFKNFGEHWHGEVIEVNLPKGQFTFDNLDEATRTKIFGAKILLLIADKGIGKTEFISNLVDKAIDCGSQTLIVSPLQSLALEASARTGIPYRKPSLEGIFNKKERSQAIEEASTIRSVLGYSLCLDSFTPVNSVPFHPYYWQNANLVYDEADQTFWHLGTGKTEIKNVRASVIQATIDKIVDCWQNERQIVLSSADLSPLELNLCHAILSTHGEIDSQELERSTVILKNQAKTKRGRAIIYDESQPKQWRRDLECAMANGENLLVQTTAQKPESKDGTINLAKLAQRYYQPHEILRLDSETLSDANNPWAKLSGKAIAQKIEADGIKFVTASPSLSTGFDLSGLDDYFSGVWLVTSGNVSVDLVSQTICRLRDFQCPRYIWCSEKGNGFYDSRSVNPVELTDGFKSKAKAALTSIGVREVEAVLEAGLNPFDTYRAFKGAKLNSQMWQYRAFLMAKLEDEGWFVFGNNQLKDLEQKIGTLAAKELDETISPEESKLLASLGSQHSSLTTSVKQTWKTRHEIQVESIAENDLASINAEDIDEERAKALERKLRSGTNLTTTEKFQLRKFALKQKYQVNELTPQILEMERKKLYPALKLRYWLSLGRDLVAQRDRKLLEDDLNRNLGKYSLYDFTNKEISTSVNCFESSYLNLARFLETGREWSNLDPELLEFSELIVKHLLQVNQAFGAGISTKDSPITKVQKLLKKVGLKLPLLRKIRSGKQRLRVYGAAVSLVRVYIDLETERQIFEGWDSRSRSDLKDFIASESSLFNPCPTQKRPFLWNEWDSPCLVRDGGTATLINNIYSEQCPTQTKEVKELVLRLEKIDSADAYYALAMSLSDKEMEVALGGLSPQRRRYLVDLCAKTPPMSEECKEDVIGWFDYCLKEGEEAWRPILQTISKGLKHYRHQIWALMSLEVREAVKIRSIFPIR